MNYFMMGILLIPSVVFSDSYFEDNISLNEEKRISEARAIEIKDQGFEETIKAVRKTIDTSGLSDQEKQFFYKAIPTSLTASAECGAMVCLSELDMASKECDYYIKKYFKVRGYKKKLFGKVFSPSKTLKKRFKYLDRCVGPKKEKKVAINLLYGLLYNKP